MDGFELLKRLKAHHQWIRIPVILLTAKGELTDKLSALTIGIDDYITKPFIVEELFARIENALKNVAARGQLPLTKAASTKETLPAIRPSDLHWLEQLNQLVTRELKNPHYNLEDFAAEMNLSKRQFQRKIKLTNPEQAKLRRLGVLLW